LAALAIVTAEHADQAADAGALLMLSKDALRHINNARLLSICTSKPRRTNNSLM